MQQYFLDREMYGITKCIYYFCAMLVVKLYSKQKQNSLILQSTIQYRISFRICFLLIHFFFQIKIQKIIFMNVLNIFRN